MENIHFTDAFNVLNAARQNYFTKDFEKSIDSKGRDDYYHNEAMTFRQALAGAAQPANLALVKKFLNIMNGSVLPPPVIRPIKRTLVLLDATGSMRDSIKACKEKIQEVFDLAQKILTQEGVEASFELQFATFRNYDQDAPYLLSCSSWEKRPDNLKSFITHVDAFGGDFARFLYERNFAHLFLFLSGTHEEEAIEVALQYANLEHGRNEISQVILIGDAPSNTKDQVLHLIDQPQD